MMQSLDAAILSTIVLGCKDSMNYDPRMPVYPEYDWILRTMILECEDTQKP